MSVLIPTSDPSPSPFLGKVIEICIVTPDLLETLTGLVQLGIGPFKIYKFNPTTVSKMTIGSELAPFEIDVAFAEQNGMVWEVMRPVKGEAVMQRYLDAHPRGGIQHVAFDVPRDSRVSPEAPLVGEAVLREASRVRSLFEQRGFKLAQSGSWQGKRGTCEFMFFDTLGAINTCCEAIIFSDDWEDPENVEHFPPRQS